MRYFRSFLIVWLFLFYVSSVFASDNQFKQKLKVQFVPLPVNDITPRYRFGLFYESGKRVNYSLDIGYGNTFMNKWRIKDSKWEDNYSFYELRPEFQYFLSQNQYFSIYGATELFYLQMKSIFTDGVYESEQGQTVSYARANYNKQKYGAHLKLGVVFHARPRIDVDFFAGIGVAHRKIDYYNVVNAQVEDYVIFTEWFPQTYLYEGETILPHLTGGFKVSWAIWVK